MEKELDTHSLNLVAMDARICLALSAAETLALYYKTSPSYTVLFQRFSISFILQFLFIKLFKLLIYPTFFSPLRNVPGPKDNVPLLGQLPNQLKQSDPTALYVKWINDYPDTPFIRYLSFGNSEVLLVNSLKAYKEVLQTQCYSFIKPTFFKRLVGEIVGVGLLFTEGEEHRRQRRLMAGPFSFANLKALIPVFHDKALVLVDTIREAISVSGQGAVVELSSLFSKATLDIIGVTTLGIELDNLGGTSKMSFQECYHAILDQPAVGNVISIINMYIPLRSWLPLEANRRFVAANKQLRSQLRALIKQRRQEVRDGKVDGKDLMTFMMRERDSGSKNGNPWTGEDVLGHLLNFMAAGHETTAGTLTWAIYAMCVHEGVQEKLREEVLAVFPKGENKVPSWDEIEGLKYLNNFVKEVLRRYAPTITAPREAARDLMIEGVHISKGTSVIVAMAVANLHPRVWGGDAMEFRPERWDEMSKGIPAANPFALETFINGPRVCIGKNFALLEVKVLLVELVRRLEFMWPEGADRDVELVNTFVRKVKGGMKARVRPL